MTKVRLQTDLTTWIWVTQDCVSLAMDESYELQSNNDGRSNKTTNATTN